jgi:hypothetical protein
MNGHPKFGEHFVGHPVDQQLKSLRRKIYDSENFKAQYEACKVLPEGQKQNL